MPLMKNTTSYILAFGPQVAEPGQAIEVSDDEAKDLRAQGWIEVPAKQEKAAPALESANAEEDKK